MAMGGVGPWGRGYGKEGYGRGAVRGRAVGVALRKVRLLEVGQWEVGKRRQGYGRGKVMGEELWGQGYGRWGYGR